MRTTVEIPDEMFRLAKQVSLERDCTFRELVIDALMHEMKGKSPSQAARRHALPSIQVPASAPILSMTPDQLAAADAREEFVRHADIGR